MSEKRLSGNHLVVVVLALSAALILAPAGVYAAATQKVKIVDTSKAKRGVHVTKAGRMLVDVTGNVTGNVTGSFNGNVVVPPPANPVHLEGASAAASFTSLGKFNPGTRLAFSSINALGTSAGGSWSQLLWMKPLGNGTCAYAGATQVSTVANFRVNTSSETFSQSYPTPLVHTVGATPECLIVVAAADLQIVVDGYQY